MGWLPRGQVLSRLVEEGGLMDCGGGGGRLRVHKGEWRRKEKEGVFQNEERGK